MGKGEGEDAQVNSRVGDNSQHRVGAGDGGPDNASSGLLGVGLHHGNQRMNLKRAWVDGQDSRTAVEMAMKQNS